MNSWPGIEFKEKSSGNIYTWEKNKREQENET